MHAMRHRNIIAILSPAVAIALVGGTVASAAASPAASTTASNAVGPTASNASALAPTYSAEQVGYTTGGGWHFRYVRTTFKLPDASQFAAVTGSFGLSVQLWSESSTAVLGISTCTTSSCQLGGTAVSEPYNAAVAVFNHDAGHTVAYSNGSSPPMAAGDTVTLSIYFDLASGYDHFLAVDNTTGVSFGTRFADPGELYFTARVGAEFGFTPWSSPAGGWAAPASRVRLAEFATTLITSYNGTRGTLTGKWSSSPIILTSDGTSRGTHLADAPVLWSSGRNFGVWLEN